jgi:hypothetical protein
MFSFFKKSTPEIAYTDKVWQKHEYRVKAMFMMIMSRLQTGKSSLVVSFFLDDAGQLKKFLMQHDLSFTVWRARLMGLGNIRQFLL